MSNQVYEYELTALRDDLDAGKLQGWKVKQALQRLADEMQLSYDEVYMEFTTII